MAARAGTREEWLEARQALLEREKQLTRQSDELARARRELPWVPVDKEYVFETDKGRKTLAELFDGRSQLIVYHFMHGPLTPEGCKGCTFATDSFDRTVEHLAAHDVTLVCAARSPLETLNEYKKRLGWTVPFVSSGGTEFNEDFIPPEWRADDMELMALSVFALEDGVVYHTYTTSDRGTDVLNPVWQLLDRSPKGREHGQPEDWPLRRYEY